MWRSRTRMECEFLIFCFYSTVILGGTLSNGVLRYRVANANKNDDPTDTTGDSKQTTWRSHKKQRRSSSTNGARHDPTSIDGWRQPGPSNCRAYRQWRTLLWWTEDMRWCLENTHRLGNVESGQRRSWFHERLITDRHGQVWPLLGWERNLRERLDRGPKRLGETWQLRSLRRVLHSERTGHHLGYISTHWTGAHRVRWCRLRWSLFIFFAAVVTSFRLPAFGESPQVVLVRAVWPPNLPAMANALECDRRDAQRLGRLS
jgi:hypothetical protein